MVKKILVIVAVFLASYWGNIGWDNHDLWTGWVLGMFVYAGIFLLIDLAYWLDQAYRN